MELEITTPNDLVAHPDCSICSHPRRAEIDAALADPKAKLKDLEIRFDVYRQHLQKHIPHLQEAAMIVYEGQEPIDRFKKRIKGRSSVLFQAAMKVLNSEDGNPEKAAKLADVAFKYDAMLAKLIQAPGFASSTGDGDKVPAINAPGSNFLIQQGAAVQPVGGGSKPVPRALRSAPPSIDPPRQSSAGPVLSGDDN